MATDFLSKAHDTLLAAQVLLEKELYDSCANRAYYAAFQAALAALTSFGLKAEKSEHKWVQATFNLIVNCCINANFSTDASKPTFLTCKESETVPTIPMKRSVLKSRIVN